MVDTAADKRTPAEKRRDHFLFGCGVAMEILKSYLFLMVARGKGVSGRPMTLEFILVSAGILGFLLGVKGIYKCKNNDNHHNYDRYPGAWVAAMVGLFWFGVHFAYFMGFVLTIPEYMTLNTLLIFGLLGITKGFDIWALIAAKFPFPRLIR